VVTGIVPKMAIRFSSFEYFKEKLTDPKTGVASSPAIFTGI
jgi:solute carrier family 25 (mitochondrial citrate transporter), member 1